jgi:hypothetical protein
MTMIREQGHARMKLRVAAARKQRGKKKFKEEYFDENTGMLYCKLCQSKLRAARQIEGRAVMVETANYREITIKFDDGSVHETALCKKCAYNISTQDSELVYALDLEQWNKEDDGKVKRVSWETLADKKINHVLPFSRQVG